MNEYDLGLAKTAQSIVAGVPWQPLTSGCDETAIGGRQVNNGNNALIAQGRKIIICSKITDELFFVNISTFIYETQKNYIQAKTWDIFWLAAG
jgi:hypothetical protein